MASVKDYLKPKSEEDIIKGLKLKYTSQKELDKALLRASSEGRLFAIEPLLRIGANIEAKDEFKNTPLIFAAYYDHKEIVEILLDKGADVNAKDSLGKTSLDWAINYSIEELLKKYGAKE